MACHGASGLRWACVVTAYQERCEREDEADRLALLARCGARWHGKRPGSPDCGCGWGELCTSRPYRPADKQGDVEPFNVQADWEERA